MLAASANNPNTIAMWSRDDFISRDMGSKYRVLNKQKGLFIPTIGIVG